MIEIIPNWHPIFVHFTVALLSIAVVLFVLVRFVSNEKLRSQWETVAQWNLWLGAIITMVTVAMGIVAYNTVAHDTPSHEAMTEHRNLALVTAVLFLLLAVWSALRARAGQSINTVILLGLLVGGGLLLSTAWHGGELVYRHGLGVLSLPKTDHHGHAGSGHEHGSGADDHAAVPGHPHHAAADDMHGHGTAQTDDVENCELSEAEIASLRAQGNDESTHMHDEAGAHSHDDTAPTAPEAHDDGHTDHQH